MSSLFYLVSLYSQCCSFTNLILAHHVLRITLQADFKFLYYPIFTCMMQIILHFQPVPFWKQQQNFITVHRSFYRIHLLYMCQFRSYYKPTNPRHNFQPYYFVFLYMVSFRHAPFVARCPTFVSISPTPSILQVFWTVSFILFLHQNTYIHTQVKTGCFILQIEL